jgi:hypothetical protein
VNAAIAGDPGMKQAYFLKLEFLLEAKRHAEVPEMLDTLQNRFGVQVGELTGLEPFKDFVTSAEYETWHKSREVQPIEP